MSQNETPKDLKTPWTNALVSDTWTMIVAQALGACSGPTTLGEIYSIIEQHPRASAGNTHWRNKVRQQLQASKRYVRVGPGTWDLAARYEASQNEEFERLRRARYPLKPKPQS